MTWLPALEEGLQAPAATPLRRSLANGVCSPGLTTLEEVQLLTFVLLGGDSRYYTAGLLVPKRKQQLYWHCSCRRRAREAGGQGRG